MAANEPKMAGQVGLRYFCYLGAVCSLLPLLVFSYGFFFNEAPRGGNGAFLSATVIDAPIFMFMLFMFMLNLRLARAPWSIAQSRAQLIGVFITVATVLITPFSVQVTFPFIFIHLIPWAGAVSGLGLWHEPERWLYSLLSAFFAGLFHLIILIIVMVLIINIRHFHSVPTTGTTEMTTEFNDKPVIYLYPQQTQRIDVKLQVHNGTLSATYPPYDFGFGGWRVIAESDGTLRLLSNAQTYSYLFWESINTKSVPYDLSKGFVVRGSDVREFLAEVLPQTGLLPREYNEFIVYWYPKLMNIPLMQIYFAGAEYDAAAPLTIAPHPDSLLRVFMVVRPLERSIELEPQQFRPFTRQGFTVVEWGGTVLAK